MHYKHSDKLIDLEGKRFVYMYRTSDGSMITEVVTLLPDANYVTSSKNGIPFSGKIIVEDWSGNFIKAYHYAHDKIYHTKSVSYGGGDEKEVQANDPVNVNSWTAHCETTHYWYYNTVGGVEGPHHYNGSETHCWYVYNGEPDLLKAVDFGENGGGGSGGGGSTSGSISPAAAFMASIDDSKLDPCMQPIMNDVKKLSQGVGQIVTKFAGNTPGFNWEVKDGVINKPNQKAYTDAAYDRINQVVTTTFCKYP